MTGRSVTMAVNVLHAAEASLEKGACLLLFGCICMYDMHVSCVEDYNKSISNYKNILFTYVYIEIRCI